MSADARTHLALFLDAQPELEDNPAHMDNLQKCWFKLGLRAHDGEADFCKGAPRAPFVAGALHVRRAGRAHARARARSRGAQLPAQRHAVVRAAARLERTHAAGRARAPCCAGAPPLRPQAPSTRCSSRARALMRRAAPRRGFPRFMALSKLSAEQERFVEDNTLTVVVEAQCTLRVAPAPPALPHASGMWGLDTDLFLQQPVLEVSLCGVCLGVMNDPVCCPTGHKCGGRARGAGRACRAR
jgi:hypothetical protein